jgi:hypothetical protein
MPGKDSTGTASKNGSKKKTTSTKTATSSDASSKTGTFDDLVAQLPPQAQTIARRLREIVYDELPDAEETVWIKGWRLALYKDVSEVCGIGPVKEYVNFYLTRGIDIPDPDRLLEGKGKGIRHVKVRSLDDMPEEAIRGFIRYGKKLLEK